MSIEEELQNIVSTDPAVLALIYHGNEDGLEMEHMFPQFATEKAVPPFVIYSRAATPRLRTMGGPVGRAQVTFTITSWATTYTVAIDLSNKVREVLDGASGLWVTETVEHCNVTDEADVFVASPEAEENRYYGRQLTVEIQHTETP